MVQLASLSDESEVEDTLWEEIAYCVPNDHSRQTEAADLLRAWAPRLSGSTRVLDVGCGAGESIDLFRELLPSSQWVGVDIEASPEVASRVRADGEFVTFDGVHLPCGDNEVDLVYSRQVLEHVRHPEQLLADILRVLKPGGLFMGSTSNLEPYHSYSIWGYTPYGFCRVLTELGFVVNELRPGIDAVALLMRAYTRSAAFNDFFSEESPLNREIDEWAAATGRGARHANVRKLRFCGHFSFVAQRPLPAL